MNLRNHWFEEYQLQKGIPSSYRREPSGSVCAFYDYLTSLDLRSGRVLDLGSGLGRNAVFLAERGFEVQCVDFVEENIESIQRIARDKKLPIQAHCQSVTEPLPFEPGEFDVAMDVFCYKHQVESDAQLFYRQELSRVLKPEGEFLLSLSDLEDGFYGPLYKAAGFPKNRVVVDPITKIPSRLYTREQIEEEFQSDFDVIQYHLKRKSGIMHEELYARRTWVFFMRKKAQEKNLH